MRKTELRCTCCLADLFVSQLFCKRSDGLNPKFDSRFPPLQMWRQGYLDTKYFVTSCLSSILLLTSFARWGYIRLGPFCWPGTDHVTSETDQKGVSRWILLHVFFFRALFLQLLVKSEHKKMSVIKLRLGDYPYKGHKIL